MEDAVLKTLSEEKEPHPKALVAVGKALRRGEIAQPVDLVPEPAASAERLKRLFPEEAAAALADARHTADGLIDLFGVSDFDLYQFARTHGGPHTGLIPWHWDFLLGGYYFDPEKYNFEAGGTATPRGTEGKTPRDLSRHYQWLWLAEGYLLSGDKTFLEALNAQILDWLEHAPPGFGAGWTAVMNVAIRAANWTVLWDMLHGEGLEDLDLGRWLWALYRHGAILEKHLEAWPIPKGHPMYRVPEARKYINADGEIILKSNHYIGNLFGMFYAGLFFRRTPDGARWLEFAHRELVGELVCQTNPDGLNFEASTNYHRFVGEYFVYFALAARRNGLELPDELLQRLRSAMRALKALIPPNGLTPQIGDTDNGRVIAFGRRQSMDHTYLLSLGAAFFEDISLLHPLSEWGREGEWVFAQVGHAALSDTAPEEPNSTMFPDSGLAVLRRGKDYVLLSSGPCGQMGAGGHSHCDKNGVEIHLDGEPLVMDTGTFLYQAWPSQRTLFRSTAMHSTVQVDGQDMMSIEEDKPFFLEDTAQARLIDFDSSVPTAIGEHHGYGHLEQPVTHRREVSLTQRGVRIEDTFDTPEGAPHEYTLRFIVHPSVEIEFNPEGGFVLSSKAGEYLLALEAVPEGLTALGTEPAFYSPEYGARQETLAAFFRVKAEGELRLVTTLVRPSD